MLKLVLESLFPITKLLNVIRPCGGFDLAPVLALQIAPEQRTQMAQMGATIPYVFEDPAGTFHVKPDCLHAGISSCSLLTLVAFQVGCDMQWIARF